MARPTIYTEEMADKMIGLIIEGNSLHAVCQKDYFPAYSTAMRWKSDPEHPFSVKYARARVDRGTYWGEKVAEISLAVLGGKVDPMAARVAIDGIKWSAGRMNPRDFGDRVDVSAQVTATVGVLAAPISPETLEEWLALEDGPGGGVPGAPGAPAASGAREPPSLPEVVAVDEPASTPAVEVDRRKQPLGVVRV